MLWVCKKYTYLHLYYTQRKETSRIVHNVRFRYGGANKKTGGGAGDAESEQDLETKSGRRRRGRPQKVHGCSEGEQRRMLGMGEMGTTTKGSS